MSESTVRAAVVQAAPVCFDLNATLDRVAERAEQAKREGAELVVFPEAFLGGYPKGADFEVRVGLRTEAGRQQFQQYAEAALSIPGPEYERLLEIVRDLKLVMVIGAIERDPSETLYCTALTLDASGLLAKHRKVMPTAMERVIWGFGDGASLKPVQASCGRVAAAICWENYMPQLRLRLFQQHVQLYCAPTVDDREIWSVSMRHIAYEGRCFVLSACQHARRSDYPADYVCVQGEDPQTTLIRGGSCLVDPLGQVLAGPIYDQDAILVADLDLGAITRGKFDLDVAGHYGRPDIFGPR